MNIGIVTTWFERGAAIVSRAYMDVLSQRHNVFIYARGGERCAIGDPKWDAPYVTWGKRTRATDYGDIDRRDFFGWIERYDIQSIIFNEELRWDIILACHELPLLIGAYVDYYTKETVPFFSLFDFLLCNTRRHYSVFRHHHQAYYIPWGTDCELYRPQSNHRHARCVKFFHSAGMGGVNLRKGTDILVRAFQNVSGDARLILHSQVPSSHYATVSSIIEKDSRISFIERTVGAPGLYFMGDVYVYPSRLDGVGLTIAEALASGLPVITTDCPPMSEFVQDGRTGALVQVESFSERKDGYYWPEATCSTPALTMAMQSYVDHPGRIREQSENARTYASRRRNWQKNASCLSGRIETLSRAPEVSSKLKRAALQYVRREQARLHLGVAFDDHQIANRRGVLVNLAKGLCGDPVYLSDLGVWSIAVDAILGERKAGYLHGIARRVMGTG